MVANNYLDEGRPHKEVIELIALGFIGKLLQWWNNCLTEESKENIKKAIQKEEEGLPIFDERLGRGIHDGVNTLIYTIIKHFVGKPSNITSRIYDQLSNLRCRTLGDNRWYEDVFTTRVMHKSDCNSPFWKEKFINGLPRIPSEEEKLMKKVIEQNNYTNQCFDVIGKQLDRVEEKIENKVILQPGNPSKPDQTLEKPLVKLPTTRHTSLRSKDVTALEIVNQKLEELVKKEPVTPSPNKATQLNVLDIHTASSNSSRTSSENEKEIERIESQF
ncbi:hypothetical protein SO802_005490 [Lithocarpus litseifolius]|uniref:DUF7746 domain-containing protein n=1 Tax=Lithocarpus litseifolius TaxID=425828 RepID=A0AAW2DKV0_9ROSI